MQIELKRAKIRIRLASLLDQTFEVTEVKGEGTTFLFRQKILSEDASNPRVALLPHIEGWSDPPLRVKETPTPPPTSALTVRVGQVDVGVSQAQLNEYNFKGHARATGAFHFNTLTAVDVTGAHLDVTDGEIRVGEALAFSHLAGTVTCDISPFNPRRVLGSDVLSFVSAQLKMNLELENAGAIVDSLKRGSGPLQLDLRIRAGRLASQSTLNGKLTGLQVRQEGYQWTSDLKIIGEKGVVLFRFEPIELKHQEPPRFSANFRRLDLQLSASRDRLQDLFAGLELEGELKPNAVRDFRWLNAFLPHSQSLEIRSGEGKFGLRFKGSVASGKGHALLVASGEKTQLRLQSTRIQADWNVSLPMTKIDLKSGKIFLGESTIHLRNLESLQDKSFAKFWWADIVVANGALRPAAGVSFSGTVKARLRDLRPLWLLYESQSPLPPWVPNLLAMEGLEASGSIRVGPSLIELSQFKAMGKNISVNGEVELHQDNLWAVSQVTAGLLSAAIELKDKKTEWTLFGTKEWFEGRIKRHQGLSP